MIRLYKKGKREQVSDHFWSTDFDCPCKQPDCRVTSISVSLIDKLETLRSLAGQPVTVDKGGGCRCEWYEKDLGSRGMRIAKKLSQHILGKAADISIPGLSGAEIESLARRVGFRAVGVAKNWAHVDERDDEDRRWIYP